MAALITLSWDGVSMSTLFTELFCDVAYIVMKSKTGGASKTLYLANEFWAADELYSGNPAIYPLLVGTFPMRRGVGLQLGIPYDVELQVMARESYGELNINFSDLCQKYEIHGAAVELRSYFRPLDAATTHAAATNIRQTLEVIDSSLDSDGRLMTLRCKDAYFKDKEVSKKVTSAIFGDIEPDYDGEYGAVVFGEATTAANGVMIDAPIIVSNTTSNIPQMKVFSGWTAGGYPNHAFKRLMVRNQHLEVDPTEWLEANLPADPQTARSGDTTWTLATAISTANWARDLTKYKRARVYTPSGSKADILTAVRCQVGTESYDGCIDISPGGYLYSLDGHLSAGNKDMTIELWVKLDSIASDKIICQQGNSADSTLEWALVFTQSSSKFEFKISTNGAAVSQTATWSATASAATWYHIVCGQDVTNDQIYIAVNAGTVVTQARGTDEPTQRHGAFMIGDSPDTGFSNFDGKIKGFRYWRSVRSSGTRTTLYNSGVPYLYEEFSEALKQDLICAYALNERIGNRVDEHSNHDLLVNDWTLVQWAESARTITTTNKHGELSLEIFAAEYVSDGDTYKPISSELRKAIIDVGASGIKGGTQSAYFQINPPLVMSPNAVYMVVLDFSNTKSQCYFATCGYKSTGGTNHYALNKNDQEQGWTKQTDVELAMAFYCVGDGDDAWKDGTTSGTHRYSYYHLEAKTINLLGAQTHQEFKSNMQFKIGISGVEDDGSGTYTGSANAAITNGSDIIRWFLLGSSLGLGLSSALVDDTSFTEARDRTYNDGLALQVVLDRKFTARELIEAICWHTKLQFYKNRQGVYCLHYPTYSRTAYSYRLSEARLRDELKILATDDTDHSQIVNTILQGYAPNVLNAVIDAATLRRAESDRFSGVVYTDENEDTVSDAARIARAVASQTLYGRRESRRDLPWYDSATPAGLVSHYYFDRLHLSQTRVKARLLRKDWYNLIDLFAKVRISHTNLPAAYGNERVTKHHDQGTPSTMYDEGIACLHWSGGSLGGEVVEIEENGPYMDLTIETQGSFAADT